MKYIDVSEWQGAIDWEKVKGNVDGVILRAGYGKGHIDKTFIRNAKECNRLNIPIGAYWFSYAKSTQEAQNEARFLVDAVKPYRMELPLAFDWEYASYDNAVAQGVKIDKDTASSLVYAFCLEVERLGYWVLNYTNLDYLSRFFGYGVDTRFGLWLAAWKLSKPADFSSPPRKCDIWQWGGSTIPGISGSVDTNESYKDFQQTIRSACCNHLIKEYDDGEGGIIIEHAAPKLKQTPLAWARSCGLCGDVQESDPVTWGGLAELVHKLHGPEDEKRDSGLLSD